MRHLSRTNTLLREANTKVTTKFFELVSQEPTKEMSAELPYSNKSRSQFMAVFEM